jgi:hypothetical protein
MALCFEQERQRIRHIGVVFGYKHMCHRCHPSPLRVRTSVQEIDERGQQTCAREHVGDRRERETTWPSQHSREVGSPS